MGLGLLGGALNDARFLLECGADLTITDLKSAEELKPSIDKLKKWPNIKYVLGHHDLADFKNADYILQPGNVPTDSSFLIEAKKNNIPIHESESLFFECAEGIKTIGVTGTRGKSTTTALIYEILKSVFGKKVHLGGNVKGSSTLSLLKKIKSGDLVVLELDSWCLNGLGAIKRSPNIAVFTNLMPDHLNYYLRGSSSEVEAMQKYFMDKAQIFANQKAEDYLILDKEIEKIIEERYKGDIKSRLVLIKDDAEIKTWKLKILGEHNFKHVLRAVAVAKILGVDLKVVRGVVENFGGVAGRQEFIRNYKGVKIYNDTTATTPEATLVALKALGDKKKKNIVLIFGGSDKGLDTTELVGEMKKYCKEAFLLDGTGSAKLNIEAVRCATLKEAVTGAIKKCKKGDALVFSPAFASFGMFKNEFDRGDKFVKIIKGLKS